MDKLWKDIKTGNYKKISGVVPKKVGSNDLDEQRRTPLHWAAEWGQSDAIEYLIQNGSNLDVKDVRGNTPLHLAVANNHDRVALLLLGKGANPEIENLQGKTASWLATMSLNKKFQIDFSSLASKNKPRVSVAPSAPQASVSAPSNAAQPRVAAVTSTPAAAQPRVAAAAAVAPAGSSTYITKADEALALKVEVFPIEEDDQPLGFMIDRMIREFLDLSAILFSKGQVGPKAVSKADIVLSNLDFLVQSIIPKLDEEIAEFSVKKREAVADAFSTVELRVNQVRDKVHLYKMVSFSDDRQIKKYIQISIGSLFWFYCCYNEFESEKVVSFITEVAMSVKEMMGAALNNINQYSGTAKRATTAYTKLLFEVGFAMFAIQDPKHCLRLNTALKHSSNILRQITLDTFKSNGVSQEAISTHIRNLADFLKIVKEGLKNIVFSLRGNPISQKDEEEIYKNARTVLEDSIKWFEGRGGARGPLRPLVDAIRPLTALIEKMQVSAVSGDMLGIYEASTAISACSSECFAQFLPEATSTADVEAKELILVNLKTMLCFSNILLICTAAQITQNKIVHRGQLAYCIRNLSNCATFLVDSLALLRA